MALCGIVGRPAEELFARGFTRPIEDWNGSNCTIRDLGASSVCVPCGRTFALRGRVLDGSPEGTKSVYADASRRPFSESAGDTLEARRLV
eukprot:scaffold973_cov399-Prasinococcus_capsulatus_cf.AAC.26